MWIAKTVKSIPKFDSEGRGQIGRNETSMRYFKTSLRPSVNYFIFLSSMECSTQKQIQNSQKAQSYLFEINPLSWYIIKWPKGGGRRGGMSVRRYNVSLTTPVKTHSVRCQSSAEGSVVFNLAKFWRGRPERRKQKSGSWTEDGVERVPQLHILKQLIFCYLKEFSPKFRSQRGGWGVSHWQSLAVSLAGNQHAPV